MNLEAEPLVLVAPLLVVFVVRGHVGRKVAEKLGGSRQVIDRLAAGVGRLDLVDDRHVPRVGVAVDEDAPPVARRGGRVARVGVALRLAVEVESGRRRVVVERSQYDRIVGRAENVQRPADPVLDIERFAVGGESGIGALEFDDQAGVLAALQPQATEGVEVVDRDFIAEDVDDVGVVPDRLGGQRRAANHHAVDLVAAAAR